MAKLTTLSGALDTSYSYFQNASGLYTSISSTQFKVGASTGYSYVVGGSGFSDNDKDGTVDVGTIAAIAVLFDNVTQISLTGLTLPVSSFNGLTQLSSLLSGNDLVTGSGLGDHIYGSQGNDTYRLGAGDDFFNGGAGKIIVRGGNGNDDIQGQAAGGDSQSLYGDLGDDTLKQSILAGSIAATVLVDGGGGNDQIVLYNSTGDTGAANLTLSVSGGAGNDLIEEGSALDPDLLAGAKLDGGSGTDTLRVRILTPGYMTSGVLANIEVLEIGSLITQPVSTAFLASFSQINSYSPFYPGQRDWLSFTLADGGAVDLSRSLCTGTSITLSAYGNQLIGTGSADYVNGGAGDDQFIGGAGNDLFHALTSSTGSTGYDEVQGGAGNDQFMMDESTTFAIDGGGGIDTASLSLQDFDSGYVFNARIAGSLTGIQLRPETAIRDVEAFSIVMTDFDDTFIDGGVGTNDTVNVLSGSDTVRLSGGRDYASAGPIAVSGTPEDVDETAIDRIQFDYRTAPAGLNMEAGPAFGYDPNGIPSITVFSGKDADKAAYWANAVNFDRVTVLGTAFADTLIGFRENDTLRGFDGDDVFVAQYGADTIDGGNGVDTLRLVFGTYYFSKASGSQVGAPDLATAGAKIDLALTTRQPLPATSSSSPISPPGSVIVLSIENIEGTRMADTLSGNASANLLRGMDGGDTLDGRSGADRLEGGGGADILIGGAGSDTLLGGSGNDIFRFKATTDSTTGAIDTISDFKAGDKIDLAAIDAMTGGTDDPFSFIGTAAFSKVAGQLRAVTDSAGVRVEGDVNGDGMADLVILVAGKGALVVGDFVL